MISPVGKRKKVVRFGGFWCDEIHWIEIMRFIDLVRFGFMSQSDTNINVHIIMYTQQKKGRKHHEDI